MPNQKQMRQTNHRHNPIVIPQIVPRNIQLDIDKDNFDEYNKYLHSKEILTARESKDRKLPRTSQNKMKHKRGGSFGIGSIHHDYHSKDLPQSGLSM